MHMGLKRSVLLDQDIRDTWLESWVVGLGSELPNVCLTCAMAVIACGFRLGVVSSAAALGVRIDVVVRCEGWTRKGA